MFDAERSWTRREFLKLAGRSGLLGAVPTLASAAAALKSDTVCISILHTTDLHGHILPTSDYDGTPDRGGLARCVTQIRRWRRQNRNPILIDVGDVYQGTEVSLRNKGELMIDLFNYLEYDPGVVFEIIKQIDHQFAFVPQTYFCALIYVANVDQNRVSILSSPPPDLRNATGEAPAIRSSVVVRG